MGKRIKKVFFHMIWILMGKSWCYIQFLSLAYEEECYDLRLSSDYNSGKDLRIKVGNCAIGKV